MIKLHVPLWELLWRGTALYLTAHFMIRGHMFKRRLVEEQHRDLQAAMDRALARTGRAVRRALQRRRARGRHEEAA
jgi:hypothetical protein